MSQSISRARTYRGHTGLSGLRSIVAWLVSRDAEYRSMAHLQNLSDAHLEDIGLRPEDVRRQFKPASWNPPVQLR